MTDTPTMNTISSTELDRQKISTAGDKIRLSDTDKEYGLDLFCYKECNASDEEWIKRCRGVVFHDDEIIMQAFPFTDEYTLKDISSVDLTDCQVFKSYEGTLIRMFYFKDKWFVTTHRKLDAYKSKWASKTTFGEQFQKAVEHHLSEYSEYAFDTFTDDLDISKQYMFLIRHNDENRVVHAAPEKPTVYHVGTMKDGVTLIGDKTLLPAPTPLPIKTVDDISEYLSTVNPMESQGVICFTPNNKQFKIITDEYKDLCSVRGNEPSIKFRYLQLRTDPVAVKQLESLYPEHIPSFANYERIICEVGKVILYSYIRRFIKKEWDVVPQEEYRVVRECHGWHMADRTNNLISYDKVLSVLNTQPPSCINRMISHQIQWERASNDILSGQPHCGYFPNDMASRY
jgi:hypothetical protein